MELDDIKHEKIGGLVTAPPDCGLDPDYSCDLTGVQLCGNDLYGVIDGLNNKCPYQDIIKGDLYCTNAARISKWLEKGE